MSASGCGCVASRNPGTAGAREALATGLSDVFDRRPRQLCRESAPLGQGRRASLFVDLPRDEMALLIELVVHLGMN
jgi:hypothetical protein